MASGEAHFRPADAAIGADLISAPENAMPVGQGKRLQVIQPIGRGRLHSWNDQAGYPLDAPFHVHIIQQIPKDGFGVAGDGVIRPWKIAGVIRERGRIGAAKRGPGFREMAFGNFKNGDGLSEIEGRGVDHQQARRRNGLYRLDKLFFELDALAAIQEGARMLCAFNEIGAET